MDLMNLVLVTAVGHATVMLLDVHAILLGTVST